MKTKGSLVARKDAVALGRRLRRRKRRIVFTNGVFDIIHRGHVSYLAKARSFGDCLVLGLNSDKSVGRLKGKGKPMQSQRDRAEILLALRAVDYVVVFGEDTPDKLIRQIRPDILVKGADYKLGEIVGAEFVRSYGGRVHRVRLTPGRSTSKLERKLR
jgi:D-beta-D-heptose 7-phosphate kinase/D-beta-D-heptose 1-phosphate adenosyltransferase